MTDNQNEMTLEKAKEIVNGEGPGAWEDGEDWNKSHGFIEGHAQGFALAKKMAVETIEKLSNVCGDSCIHQAKEEIESLSGEKAGG